MEKQEKEYPLYPELSEEGKKESELLVEKFKEKLKKVAEEAIEGFYCDMIHDIESDSWQNFRNQIMDGFKNYNNRKIQNRFDFKEIRQQIFKEYREEIIPDLNQDILEENESLKNQILQLREYLEFARNH